MPFGPRRTAVDDPDPGRLRNIRAAPDAHGKFRILLGFGTSSRTPAESNSWEDVQILEGHADCMDALVL